MPVPTAIAFLRASSMRAICALAIGIASGPVQAHTASTLASGIWHGQPATAVPTGSGDIALDSAGNLLFIHPSLYRIGKVTPAGSVWPVAGTGYPGNCAAGTPAVACPLSNLVAIATRGGETYVARSHGILRIGTDGLVTPVINVSGTSIGAMAVDGAGDVYYFDNAGYVLRKVSNGAVTTIAGNGSPGSGGDGGNALLASFSSVWDIAVAANGDVFVTDPVNHKVRRISSGGIVSTIAGTGTAGFSGDGGLATAAALNMPRGITIDGAGNVLVADSQNNRVRRIGIDGIITTFAGGGGAWGDGGPATSAALTNPIRVRADSSGNVYIVNTAGLHYIRKVAGGTITTVAGNGWQSHGGEGLAAATNAFFEAADDVALHPSGDVYFADAFGSYIAKVSGGTLTRVAGTGTQAFSGDGGPAASAGIGLPRAIAISPSGDLYVGDTSYRRIRRISGGIIQTIAGNGTAGRSGDGGPATSATIDSPRAMAFDASGALYFADEFAAVIRKIDASGIITAIAGNGTTGYSGDGGPAILAALNRPSGIAVAADGTVYFSDSYNYRVRAIAPDGTISTIAGTGEYGYDGDRGPALLARLNRPMGLRLDPDGNLLVADAVNGRIRKVFLGTQRIHTIAGNGRPDAIGIADGATGRAAGLNHPTAIAIDAARNLYVAERDSNRVRKLSPRAPDAPVVSMAQVGSQFRLEFDEPDDGGHPMTRYLVTPSHGAPFELPAVPGSGYTYHTGNLDYGTEYSFQVVAYNALGASPPSATVSGTLVAAPVIRSNAPSNGSVGTWYWHAFVTEAYPTPTFTHSGTLPPGLQLSSAGGISGTPTTAGSFTATAIASNGVGSPATQTFTITIAKGAQVITFDPPASRGRYSQPITLSAAGGGSGNPVTFASLTPSTCTTTDAAGSTLTPVAAGTCTIRAAQAGNANYEPGTLDRSITITNEAAPETTITSAPAAYSFARSGTFTFTGTDRTGAAVTTFRCSFDGGPVGNCLSPVSYGGFSEGSHTFSVAALDADGNLDPTPATHTWTIDSTAPSVSIDTAPPITQQNAGQYSVGGICTEHGRDVHVQVGSLTAVGRCGATRMTEYSTVPIDATSLPAGPVTLTASLADQAHNTITATRGTSRDGSGGGLSFEALDAIYAANSSTYSFGGSCFADGTSVSYSVSNTATAGGVAPCISGRFTVSGLDVSGLADGMVSLRLQQGTAGGFFVWPASGTTLKNTTEPWVTLDLAAPIDAANPSAYAISGNCSETGVDVTLFVGSNRTSVKCGAAGPGSFMATMDLASLANGDVQLVAMHTDNRTKFAAASTYARKAFATSAATDLNGDKRSDLLWRNAATGQVYRILMNGLAPSAAGMVYVESDTRWTIVGDADFDGDGVADLLWRHAATGQVYVMPFGTDGLPRAGAVVYAEPSPEWRIVHTPDLDGDGRADILWRHAATGQVYAMLMNGIAIKAQGMVAVVPDTTWHIVAVGDFAGSRRRNQLVWRQQTTGAVHVMTVSHSNAGFTQSTSPFYQEPDTAWKIVAAADLDGDGRSDLVWRNAATGQVYAMLMNDLARTSERIVHVEADLRWKIVSTGDYDGDGKSDLLWRHDTTGQVYVMRMQGLSAAAPSGVVWSEPNPDWHLLGTRAYGVASGGAEP